MSGDRGLIPETETFIPWKESRSPSEYRTEPLPRKIVDMGIQSLTPRHRRALEKIAENPAKPRQAVIEAGFSPGCATEVANKLLQRKPIAHALEKNGATDEKIAEALIEGMNKAENPFRPGLPDHNVRLGFIKEINHVKDNYPPKQVSVEQKSKVMHVHFTAENMVQFEKYNRIRAGSRE